MLNASRKFLLIALTFFLLAAFLAYIILIHPQPFPFELNFYHFLLFTSFLGSLWVAISAVYPLAVLLIILALIKFWRKNQRDETLLAILLGSGVVLTTFLKRLIHRPCPPLKILRAQPTFSSFINSSLGKTFFPPKTPADYCWPSGHTLTYTILFGGIVLLIQYNLLPRYFWSKLIYWLSLFFLFTIGLSRVFLGQHWFLDVIGGYLIGFGWLALVMSWFFQKKGKDEG